MAINLELPRPMPACSLLATVVAMLPLQSAETAQSAPPVATFKSKVDLVRVAAIVRDQKGRFVQALSVRAFTVLDGSERRPIVDFGRDSGGVTIALLFDASGSMESRWTNARGAGNHLLSGVAATRDEAAVFTFDTQLDEIVPFTVGLKQLPRSLSDVLPFRATSLNDSSGAT